jgi:hypothetical protein
MILNFVDGELAAETDAWAFALRETLEMGRDNHPDEPEPSDLAGKFIRVSVTVVTKEEMDAEIAAAEEACDPL